MALTAAIEYEDEQFPWLKTGLAQAG